MAVHLPHITLTNLAVESDRSCPQARLSSENSQFALNSEDAVHQRITPFEISGADEKEFIESVTEIAHLSCEYGGGQFLSRGIANTLGWIRCWKLDGWFF
jgi:hypothetical protein